MRHAASSPRSASRVASTTRAPHRASSRATASPMPLLPPAEQSTTESSEQPAVGQRHAEPPCSPVTTAVRPCSAWRANGGVELRRAKRSSTQSSSPTTNSHHPIPARREEGEEKKRKRAVLLRASAAASCRKGGGKANRAVKVQRNGDRESSRSREPFGGAAFPPPAPHPADRATQTGRKQCELFFFFFIYRIQESFCKV